MSETRYQGWTNHPTWAVNLWLGNDEGLYLHARELAAECVRDAPSHSNVLTGIWTVEHTARFTLADALSDWVTEDLIRNDEADLTSDLLGYAVGSVDWHEIAEHWIEDGDFDNNND